MGCESNPNPTTNLTIAPASVFLTAGTVSVVSLNASGGDSNYTWSVTSTNLGAVYGGGLTVAYVSTTNAGVDTVIVTDGEYWHGQCCDHTAIISPWRALVQ